MMAASISGSIPTVFVKLYAEELLSDIVIKSSAWTAIVLVIAALVFAWLDYKRVQARVASADDEQSLPLAVFAGEAKKPS